MDNNLLTAVSGVVESNTKSEVETGKQIKPESEFENQPEPEIKPPAIDLEDYLVSLKIGGAASYDEAVELLKTHDLDAVTYTVLFTFEPANFPKTGEFNTFEIPFTAITADADILDNLQFDSARAADITYHIGDQSYSPEELDILVTYVVEANANSSNIIIRFLDPISEGDVFLFSMRKYVVKKEINDYLKNNVLLTMSLKYAAATMVF
jgi:hypothetical protein